MEDFDKYVDSKADVWVKHLAEAVAIPSVSADPVHRPDCNKIIEHMLKLIRERGGKAETHDLGSQTMPDGSTLPLPPIVTATFGEDPSKKTVCVYGHCDVQPAALEDGWNTEPFVLTETANGAMYGRGSSDDKGPVLCWLWAIESMQALGMELPVNIKMCLECMEESGSIGLEEFLVAHKNDFFAGVDAVCISDNYWLSTTKPCITYGLRGICYYCVEIEGSTKDLHSGVFGGVVHEATVDLVKLLASLVDSQGHILIPGLMDQVAALTDAEKKLYENIAFSPADFQKEVGAVGNLIYQDTEGILMHRWRYPSLSVHGIEGAFSGAGCKTVIPRKVVGKFSIRLVPDMDPHEVTRLVEQHLQSEFAKLGSSNKMAISLEHPGKPWLADVNHPNFVAGREATKQVYGVEPDMTREGGSIPITLTFQEVTGKPVLLLPVGRSDDGAHSQNEKLDRSNYINGIKLMGHYLTELSHRLE